MNSNITSHHQTLPTICQLEWVNFLLETCGAGCIYTIILKAVTAPASPTPHRQLQTQCSSVSLLCRVCSASFAPLQTLYHKWDSGLKLFTLFKLFTSFKIWKQSFSVAITELKEYVQPSTSLQKYLKAQSLRHKYWANKFLHSQCSA